MRKSNWIIAAVLLLASVAFLWIWHALQFDLVDNPLDIVVTVVWWVVIAAACVAIHWAEKKRQERIRTIFVAPGLLYNSEMGVVRLNPNEEVVDALEGDSLKSHLRIRVGRAAGQLAGALPAHRAFLEVR